MRRISGKLLSSKPISLSVAAKRLTSFAALENGASAVVSIYLQGTAQVFNDLVLLQEPFKQQNVKKEENLDYQIDDLKVELKTEEISFEQDMKVEKKRKRKNKDVVGINGQVKTEEISVDDKKRKKTNKNKKTNHDVGINVLVKKE